MNINQLIFRNLKKNLKNYYLYVFALVFSVGLYFAFVTLQYDPSMDSVKGSIKGSASIKTASILLVAIVSVFLLFANNIFIKRRSKEIGLFQLIGLTKNRIFRILAAENFYLYFGSLIIGIFLGFSVSKLVMMVLFKITGVETAATLRFSSQAFIQTIAVFSAIYVLILLVNFFFIKKQSIISLFHVRSSTETKVKKLSVFEIIIGILGIALVITGYYVSSKLFSGDFTSAKELFGAMIFILASVIIGTYLFFKCAVSVIFNLIRKKKAGYLNIKEVLSLTSIMFRMKSNALLLTIITTVSALAIGLLSLSYISYYSAEKLAKNIVTADFSFTAKEDAAKFKQALDKEKILYNEKTIPVIQATADLSAIITKNNNGMKMDPKNAPVPVVSEKSVNGFDVKENETIFTGYNDAFRKFLNMKDSGKVQLKGKKVAVPLNYLEFRKDYVVAHYFTGGGNPVAVVDDHVFNQLKADLEPSIQLESSLFTGLTIKDETKLESANHVFNDLDFGELSANNSRLDIERHQKKNMGLMMFIVGFLGLTFLITSGCILYFKQMDEGEDEKPNYTILRKLGFTQSDLLKGIQAKQAFNFGIPLILGLMHGYFAVQSGWFFFGSELWTPMIIVMVLYTVLYSIFGILSVLYYKKVIKEAL
ncbi:FtsX-like permease family protein [Mesobacillus zeae]|uniref:ABC transporter permease n=1 Tax=Mesobacillus zeae TaxID=1917180 RepID=A0A398B392_9BACI|nr:ABC transporter permease [Mesobacillus zeae]RID82256.1 ABC transporter permease [Mesobacillus zeae]